jgi:hypothetical protein
MKYPSTFKLQFPSSIEISPRFVAYSADPSNSRSPDGRRIDESDEQAKNAEPSIHESLELDSNVIVERDLHSEKQESQIVSTE